jgi:hypothetical protein
LYALDDRPVQGAGVQGVGVVLQIVVVVANHGNADMRTWARSWSDCYSSGLRVPIPVASHRGGLGSRWW